MACMLEQLNTRSICVHRERTKDLLNIIGPGHGVYEAITLATFRPAAAW
jgi:hypothetical protein